LSLPDGAFAIGLADRGMAIIAADGATKQVFPTASTVRGRPVTYVNELLGGQQRIAYAAEALVFGSEGAWTKVDIAGGALSGPLAIAKDLDRELIVASLQGRLIAIEESTRKRLWDIDLGASEVGQLVPVDDTSMVCVLDGSRLICYDLGTSASIRWKATLEAQAIGDPIVIGSTVYLANGATIARRTTSGQALAPLKLPSAAASAVSGQAGTVAVGCKGGELVVFTSDESGWVTLCPQPVTAVCVTTEAVVSGLADGTVTAYRP